ncbi:hypothetical protein [Achromobacter sp. 2789STDY5608628]|uniref:hypothetical protein n=1 Tax=Achromobacter sp. 2789STDY5608628 TaxID=1806493 RepID=UPI0006C1B02D|nr:hypothetical protein [Achromobacter sp. 2789STDY5608628]CUJ54361.1 Uncharacterised protein [Achromobacter sp. 2789STDY5608628]
MDKYQKAILALHVAVQEINRLSVEIGVAIEASLVAQDPPPGAPFNGRPPINWLERAYALDQDDDGDRRHAHHEGDVDAYLAANCQHALRAHQLIQQRKAAKVARASARRWITKLGKELAAQQAEQGAGR